MSLLPAPSATAGCRWTAWTTTVHLVVTRPDRLEAARRLVTRWIAEVDAAASRFREDSEVARLAAAAGRPTRVSPLLARLVGVALAAAATTDGAVDPTLGHDLVALGYFGDLPGPATGAPLSAVRRPPVAVLARTDWRDVVLDGDVLTLPSGVLLDLGCTAKAQTVDECAVELADEVGGGVLLGIGGDLRAAGEPPDGGWRILVQDGPDEPADTVALDGLSAIATSSTLHRRWRTDGRELHHILDPGHRRPATPVWRTVSVAAPTCAEANVLSTWAVVAGTDAHDVLRAARRPARLVAADGAVIRTGGWPR